MGMDDIKENKQMEIKATNNNTESQKETAVHEEQQSKSKQEIINDIIKILAKHNLTISDSKDILYETAKTIYRQIVRVSS